MRSLWAIVFTLTGTRDWQALSRKISPQRTSLCLPHQAHHHLPHLPPSPENLGDLHSFDLATMTWTRLAAANAPSARYGHGFTSVGGKLYVHGGYTGSGNTCGQLCLCVEGDGVGDK